MSHVSRKELGSLCGWDSVNDRANRERGGGPGGGGTSNWPRGDQPRESSLDHRASIMTDQGCLQSAYNSFVRPALKLTGLSGRDQSFRTADSARVTLSLVLTLGRATEGLKGLEES